jgi:hypothetical protein
MDQIKAKAHKVAINIEQYATFGFTMQIKNPDASPRDLTGAHAELQVRPEPSSETFYLSFKDDGTGTTGCSIVIGSGQLSVIATPQATKLANWDSAYYDFIVTYPTGEVTRYLEGPALAALGTSR